MKRIKGYEDYGITSCGRVWSYINNRFLKQQTNYKGYLYVRLSKDGVATEYYIHRLVAEAYIPNPNNFETVDHIDNCKTHNWINNLQWMSREDNTKKAKNKKVFCKELNKIFDSLSNAAKELGIDKSNLSKACSGKQKTCGGYHWEYVEG